MSGIFGVFNSGDRPTPGAASTIWADARLYYRDELCRALGIALDESADDADLILAAYDKWGEACVDHLRGDFAFAVLDATNHTLFCARDHFGMRPFYYHHAPGKHLVFASDARNVFAVPEVPYWINEGRIADFIVPELEWIDYTSTFYEGVYRLPPGHCMILSRDKLTVREYWEPQPGPNPRPMSDDDWRDGFLEVFASAVDERLLVPQGQVGAMLSGGMDSGSIAGVASGLLSDRGEGTLRTYSAAQSQGVTCVESQRIRATTEYLGTAGTQVFPDAIGESDAEFLASIEEPFDVSFLFMQAIFQAAARDGASALLDGGGGDVVLNEGSYITRLARRGNIATAYKEVIAEHKFWESSSAMPDILRHAAKALVPNFLKSAVRPYRQRRDSKRFIASSLISAQFAKRVDVEQRCERMHNMFPTDWTSYEQERARKIRPNVSAGRERYARLAASAGVEARDPFLDCKVVDFCTRLPGHLLIRDGWPKAILRDVMAGRLPDEVCRGPGKPHIGWVFSQELLKRERSRGNLALTSLLDMVGGYLDVAKLKREWEKFETGGDSEHVHTAYVLSRWLEQTVSRPVVKNQ